MQLRNPNIVISFSYNCYEPFDNHNLNRLALHFEILLFYLFLTKLKIAYDFCFVCMVLVFLPIDLHKNAWNVM